MLSKLNDLTYIIDLPRRVNAMNIINGRYYRCVSKHGELLVLWDPCPLNGNEGSHDVLCLEKDKFDNLLKILICFCFQKLLINFFFFFLTLKVVRFLEIKEEKIGIFSNS